MGARRLPLLAALSVVSAATVLAGGRYRPLDPAAPLSFPRDHGSHDDARVEWWYVTGHLEDAGGRRVGYQLTFFRTGISSSPRAGASAWAARDLFLAHFARTDETGGSFRYAERVHRSGVGAAWALATHLDVGNEDWTLRDVGDGFSLFARARFDGEEETLSLHLTPAKPPVLHGEHGLSRKGPEPDAVSRYVSFTRLETTGYLTRGGEARAVHGLSWLDHEWGSGSIGRETAGWDWFSVQLDDGRDLMLYRMRGKGGGSTRFTSGTLVEKDGRSRPLAPAEFSTQATATWTSPRSGAAYPSRWLLRVPSAGLALEVTPLLADQELVTERSTRVTYWEGACAVRAAGGPRGAPIGSSYVELTGYAGKGALGALSDDGP